MHEQSIAADNKELSIEKISEPWLSLLLTHILPPLKDAAEYFAGARDLGIVNYARSALTEHRHQVITQLFGYAQSCLENYAVNAHKLSFMACEENQQKQILQELQQSDKRFRLFFDQLITLALEGLLSHPKHGGNRNAMGWQWVGYHHQEPSTLGIAVHSEGTLINEP